MGNGVGVSPPAACHHYRPQIELVRYEKLEITISDSIPRSQGDEFQFHALCHQIRASHIFFVSVGGSGFTYYVKFNDFRVLTLSGEKISHFLARLLLEDNCIMDGCRYKVYDTKALGRKIRRIQHVLIIVACAAAWRCHDRGDRGRPCARVQ